MSAPLFFAYHHAFGYGGGWLAHTVASAIIHSLIYSFIFRLMHGLTLAQALVLVALVLIVVFAWSRQSGQRRR